MGLSLGSLNPLGGGGGGGLGDMLNPMQMLGGVGGGSFNPMQMLMGGGAGGGIGDAFKNMFSGSGGQQGMGGGGFMQMLPQLMGPSTGTSMMGQVGQGMQQQAPTQQSVQTQGFNPMTALSGTSGNIAQNTPVFCIRLNP